MQGEVVVARTMAKDSSTIVVSGASVTQTVFTPPLYLKNGRDYELPMVNMEKY